MAARVVLGLAIISPNRIHAFFASLENMASGVSRLLLTLAILSPARALDNGAGRVPVLGWSSWNWYLKEINETAVEDVAVGLIDTGLLSLGYTHVNLDAGVWRPDRDTNGRLQADPAKFPTGLAALSSKLRARGLSIGLYTDLSSREQGFVCGTGPGSFGHFDIDAADLAVKFGAEFVKVDFCAYDTTNASRHVPTLDDQAAHWEQFRDAFNATGRQVFTYFCPRSASGGGVIDGPPAAWSGAYR